MTRIATWALLAAVVFICSCGEVPNPGPTLKPPAVEPIDEVVEIKVSEPDIEIPEEEVEIHEESEVAYDRGSDKPFDGNMSNNTIGLGGGSGGASFPSRRIGAAPSPANENSRRGGATSPWTDTESYANISHNPFLRATNNPLSTFSIDVDTASLANVRRFLREGRLPPPDAVRIEELLNWFDYSYPEPEASEPFSRTVEVVACPWRPGHELVRIGLKGRSPPKNARKPSNLVFLLDVSGSMDSPDKLPLLKQCLTMLVDRLSENDQIAIVTYASTAGLALPSTPGTSNGPLRKALKSLGASGSTNGAGGIRLAYETAQSNFIKSGINRVILATDGDFNVGISSTPELVALIKAKARTGVFLSCLGFGTGNLKDDKLEALADHGNGHYAYIDSLKEGWKVLHRQLHANLETIAKDVKIQVEFNPARVRSWRLIGYENRVLAARDFSDDSKDAGEIGAGHTVTALYEIDPVSGSLAGPGVDELRYQAPQVPVGSEITNEMLTLKLRFKTPDGEKSRKLVSHEESRNVPFSAASRDFRFAAAVALFGMTLRHSPHRAEAGLKLAMEIASGAIGDNSDRQRAEFVDLVRRAQALGGSQ